MATQEPPKTLCKLVVSSNEEEDILRTHCEESTNELNVNRTFVSR